MSATAVAAGGSACWAEACFTAYKHMLVSTARRLMYLIVYRLHLWLVRAYPSPTCKFRFISWLAINGLRKIYLVNRPPIPQESECFICRPREKTLLLLGIVSNR